MTCGPPAAKSLISTKRGRIYSVSLAESPLSGRIYGCLTSESKVWKLSPLGRHRGGARMQLPPVLNAPWAGGATESHGVDTYRLTVIARNLHTGALNKCPAGGGGIPRTRDSMVDKVVLRGNGSTAWTGTNYVYEPMTIPPGPGATAPAPGPHLQKQVTACTAEGQQLLDKGEGIDLESLELHGATLTWTDFGETRSATLG
jgi:hypothetical protein